jgi:hypothetical protein
MNRRLLLELTIAGVLAIASLERKRDAPVLRAHAESILTTAPAYLILLREIRMGTGWGMSATLAKKTLQIYAILTKKAAD